MNGITGKNGLVSSGFLFWMTTIFLIDLPNNEKRMSILAKAEIETSAIFAERIIKPSLNGNDLQYVNYLVSIGEEVVVYSKCNPADVLTMVKKVFFCIGNNCLSKIYCKLLGNGLEENQWKLVLAKRGVKVLKDNQTLS